MHGVDADYGDATAGAGDTITLTFDIATDRGGAQVGGPFGVGPTPTPTPNSDPNPNPNPTPTPTPAPNL